VLYSILHVSPDCQKVSKKLLQQHFRLDALSALAAEPARHGGQLLAHFLVLTDKPYCFAFSCS